MIEHSSYDRIINVLRWCYELQWNNGKMKLRMKNEETRGLAMGWLGPDKMYYDEYT